MRWRRLLLPGGWFGGIAGIAALIAIVTILYVPAALAFPYRAQFGPTTVYSDTPISPLLPDRIARADHLLSASPLYEPDLARTLVLTDGGWRWKLMAAGYWNTVALRRPFSRTLTFNRSDVNSDRAANEVRTLSGTIAHETVHILTAQRLGEWRNARLPAWKREGYADFVARELNLEQWGVDGSRVRDQNHRVLAYAKWRRQVAEELARNGGSVDRLFAE